MSNFLQMFFKSTVNANSGSSLRYSIFNLTSILPLITFRILFGAMMAIGSIRFMLSGWIEKLYLEPTFFFKYYGFNWVQPFDEAGMYLLFLLITISALCIMVGLFYRMATVVFFLTFTYSELIDATNYLNHYYLVCLLAFLMIFLPANRAFSLDIKANPNLKLTHVPRWTIWIIIAQLTIVYTYAGVAKLQSDWLLRAMPLAVWLPEHTDLPVLGYFFQFPEIAYIFSWAGAIYDLTIAYFLMFRMTRPWAYLFVIFFHVVTKLLFNIGLFPIIMITSTLIFFSPEFHKKLLKFIGYRSDESRITSHKTQNQFTFSQSHIITVSLLSIYLLIQILLPLRHHLYSGNVLWTEEAYRLSWRVMAVEKSGVAIFTIKDEKTGRKMEITNREYLTDFQEKQMAIQPDFILQYAHHLAEDFRQHHGFEQPIVTVDAHVALNGRVSQQFINPTVNLAEVSWNLKNRNWILPMK
jgi:hypothetical protein